MRTKPPQTNMRVIPIEGQLEEADCGEESGVVRKVDMPLAWRTPPYPSTHNMGTCRMSARPQDGVVNKWGQRYKRQQLHPTFLK